jgi:hypothetical protein
MSSCELGSSIQQGTIMILNYLSYSTTADILSVLIFVIVRQTEYAQHIPSIFGLYPAIFSAGYLAIMVRIGIHVYLV